jgi:hypothetical protein
MWSPGRLSTEMTEVLDPKVVIAAGKKDIPWKRRGDDVWMFQVF